MKKLFSTLLMALFCGFFSTTANAQTCNFGFDTVATGVNHIIDPGTTDTIAVFRIITDSCGGTITGINFIKDSTVLFPTSADTNFTNVKLYIDTVLQPFLIPSLYSTVWNTVIMNYGVTPHDTLVLTFIADIKPGAMPSGHMRMKGGFTILDSVSSSSYFITNVIGQTMTIAGCALSCTQNTNFVSQNIAPGTHIQIGSFKFKNLGPCTLPVLNVTINNIANVANTNITNVMIQKGATQMGSTLGVMGTNSVFAVNDNVIDSLIYDVYADIIYPGVNSGDSIKLTMQGFAGYSPFTGALIPATTGIGQTMTLNFGVAVPCFLNGTDVASDSTAYPGVTQPFLSIKLKPTCTSLITAIKVEDIGDALDADVTTCYFSNGTSIVSNTLSPLTFNQTFTLSENINAGQTKFLTMMGTLAATAIVGKSYKFIVTVYYNDGTSKDTIIPIIPKKVILNTLGTQDISQNHISIFPNPASEFISFNGLEKSTEILITDMSGRTMLRKFISQNDTIDVHNYPKGIYIVKSNNWQQKLIVQ